MSDESDFADRLRRAGGLAAASGLDAVNAETAAALKSLVEATIRVVLTLRVAGLPDDQIPGFVGGATASALVEALKLGS
jgi:hypothetical protein